MKGMIRITQTDLIIVRLLILLTLGLGTLLILLFPIFKNKIGKIFGLISLTVGGLILIILVFSTITSPLFKDIFFISNFVTH